MTHQLKFHFYGLLGATALASYLSGIGVEQPVAEWLLYGTIWALLSILPLLCFLPTVLNPNARSISWLSFFLLAYMVWAILKTLSPHWYAGLLVLSFNISTFYWCIRYLRPLKVAAKAKANSKAE